MQKIINAIAVASGVLTLTIIGAGIYGYKYITSDNFEKMIKNKVMGDIQNDLLKLSRASYQTPQGSLYPSNDHPRYRYTKYIYTSYTCTSNRASKSIWRLCSSPFF